MSQHEPNDLGSRATVSSGDSTVDHGASPELPPGTLVGGRYRVVRLIGRGGMGVVYEAFEATIERRVALKLLHPFVADDERATARLLEEARVANRARHPALVEVTDHGRHTGRAYLVMEFLEGESLAARIARDGVFAPGAAVELLSPVFAALGFLHQRGVVHRDLKPENLFLARVGDVVALRVLDLGIAKASAEGRSLTATDAVLGTPAYMAPEQVRSSRSVTPLADQYALGCVLYEMLSGHLPVEADNLHGLLVAKINDDPVDLRAWRPEVPGAFSAAVMRAVQRDPSQRFEDVTAFADALRSALLAAAEPGPSAVVVAPRAAAPSSRRAPRARLALAAVALTAITWWTARSALAPHPQRVASVSPPASTPPPDAAPTRAPAPAVTTATEPRAEAPPPPEVRGPLVDAAVLPRRRRPERGPHAPPTTRASHAPPAAPAISHQMD